MPLNRLNSTTWKQTKASSSNWYILKPTSTFVVVVGAFRYLSLRNVHCVGMNYIWVCESTIRRCRWFQRSRNLHFLWNVRQTNFYWQNLISNNNFFSFNRWFVSATIGIHRAWKWMKFYFKLLKKWKISLWSFWLILPKCRISTKCENSIHF